MLPLWHRRRTVSVPPHYGVACLIRDSPEPRPACPAASLPFKPIPFRRRRLTGSSTWDSWRPHDLPYQLVRDGSANRTRLRRTDPVISLTPVRHRQPAIAMPPANPANSYNYPSTPWCTHDPSDPFLPQHSITSRQHRCLYHAHQGHPASGHFRPAFGPFGPTCVPVPANLRHRKTCRHPPKNLALMSL